MKKSVKFLPVGKQNELEIVVETIKKTIGKCMVILFGSYARGDFVDSDFTIENGTLREYKSDFDIMIILSNKKAENNGVGLEYEILKKLSRIKTPLSIIIESIDHVNHQLELGRYFYKDIKKEGICLLNTAEYKLSRTIELKPEERKKMAEEDLEMWLTSYKGFLNGYGFYLKEYKEFTPPTPPLKGEGKCSPPCKEGLGEVPIGKAQDCLNKAAFNLHQATEALYSAVFLVYTSYRHKTHDLKKLGEKVIMFDERFDVWKMKTKKEQENFNLLRAAYVDARYKRDYVVTEKQLKWLERRVVKLAGFVEVVCQQVIERFGE